LRPDGPMPMRQGPRPRPGDGWGAPAPVDPHPHDHRVADPERRVGSWATPFSPAGQTVTPVVLNSHEPPYAIVPSGLSSRKGGVSQINHLSLNRPLPESSQGVVIPT